ncbi:MAG TPA: pyruvate dehydrogenase (acetyl-transferring), homodimeric type, partial [Thermogutta sp.]|nr:pyruvate dehydrogenase (acetyl-transferring), homodimeric type [Thermogutta sp.]
MAQSELNVTGSRTATDGTLPEGAIPSLARDVDPVETQEWLDALEAVIRREGPERAVYLLERLKEKAFRTGVPWVSSATTPYINTIPPEAEPEYPGDRALERRIKSLIRW